MPPKKDKKEKKAKDEGGDRPATGEGGDGDGLSVSDLKAQIKDMKDGLRKEQEERNYYQLERDKINTFWEITKKELDEKKVRRRALCMIVAEVSFCSANYSVFLPSTNVRAGGA
jgi:hypothetical protein